MGLIEESRHPSSSSSSSRNNNNTRTNTSLSTGAGSSSSSTSSSKRSTNNNNNNNQRRKNQKSENNNNVVVTSPSPRHSSSGNEDPTPIIKEERPSSSELVAVVTTATNKSKKSNSNNGKALRERKSSTSSWKSSSEKSPGNTNVSAGKSSSNQKRKDGAAEISIIDFKFIPSTVQIKAGASVSFRSIESDPNAQHRIKWHDDNSKSSGTLNPGDRYSRTFLEQGTYNFFCENQVFMIGSVIVTPATTTPVSSPITIGAATTTTNPHLTPDPTTSPNSTSVQKQTKSNANNLKLFGSSSPTSNVIGIETTITPSPTTKCKFGSFSSTSSSNNNNVGEETTCETKTPSRSESSTPVLPSVSSSSKLKVRFGSFASPSMTKSKIRFGSFQPSTILEQQQQQQLQAKNNALLFSASSTLSLLSNQSSIATPQRIRFGTFTSSMGDIVSVVDNLNDDDDLDQSLEEEEEETRAQKPQLTFNVDEALDYLASQWDMKQCDAIVYY